jgi:hypothetical protein
MIEGAWREDWSPFRVKLVDLTAECLVEQQSAATGGLRPRWDALTDLERSNVSENIARIFLAQDQAMSTILERGQIP